MKQIQIYYWANDHVCNNSLYDYAILNRPLTFGLSWFLSSNYLLPNQTYFSKSIYSWSQMFRIYSLTENYRNVTRHETIPIKPRSRLFKNIKKLEKSKRRLLLDSYIWILEGHASCCASGCYSNDFCLITFTRSRLLLVLFLLVEDAGPPIFNLPVLQALLRI